MVEIGGAGHVKAGIAQRLGDEPGIVGRGGERPGAVLVIAEDEREPRLRRLCERRRDEGERQEEKGKNCARDKAFHECFPAKRPPSLGFRTSYPP